MSSLQTFSTLQPSERLSSLPVNQVELTTENTFSDYPEINIGREILHSSSSMRGMDVICPVNESTLKRLFRTYVEKGFKATLKETVKGDFINNPALKQIAKYLLIIIGAGNQPKFSIECTKNHIIRFVSWHPNFFRIAVASSDNIIRIYNDENRNFSVLKNGIQKGITALSFRPFSASELAVGCENGALIWTVDTNSRALAQVHCLNSKNHLPITSLEWSPNGDLLATASANDSDIWLWDVDQNRHVALKRVGAACTNLSWSPDGGKLYTSTAANVFRVWSTASWKPERWTIQKDGHIKSAAWSKCGNFLLFVVSNDSYLYSLGFVQEQLFSVQSTPSAALPVADLTKTTIGQLEIGGRPEQLAWCHNDRQLAVTFSDSSAIVLFNTNINKHLLTVTPLCFFTGIGVELPTFVCFKPQYHLRKTSHQTVLTIGWTSGRIQYFPFV